MTRLPSSVIGSERVVSLETTAKSGVPFRPSLAAGVEFASRDAQERLGLAARMAKLATRALHLGDDGELKPRDLDSTVALD